jgi:hypothetical protein
LSAAALIGAWPGVVLARDAQVDAQVRRLKALQYQILISEETARLEAPRAKGHGHRRASFDSDRSRPLRDDGFAPRPGIAPRLENGTVATSRPVNLQLNVGSATSTTQSETSVAAIGSQMVAAWNDADATGGAIKGIGCGYSSDGGATWISGGALPLAGGVGVWVSDPVLVADAPHASFYVVGLVITDAARNGVAVIRGQFAGTVFSWGVPQVVRAVRDTLPDKPWMAADTTTGALYVSYTTFFRKQGHPSDQIEYQRTLGGAWTPAAKLSLDEEDGLVQGSRPAVGPNGVLHAVWKTIDTTAAAGGLDAIHIRSSGDGGATFGPLATIARLFTNFCSGPPGFNRGSGLGFPSIAIDRSAGPHRGRLYVGWEESLDFYDDPVGGAGNVTEAEPNGSRVASTAFTLGQTIRGRIDPAGDVDWFRFEGTQGQTALVILDSLETRLNVSLRLWCSDGSTALALSDPINVRERSILFTLSKTGDYFVTVAPHNDSTGSYRLSTGLALHGPERGRDQRDVFVAHSDDGLTWSAPARANDSPAGYDDWLPELAVAGDGKPYLAWLDWRDGDPENCGAASTLYLTRSDDGGDSWTSLGPVGEAPTVWSRVFSNQVPNMGDYVSLWADQRGVFPCWADGRNGDPDVFLAMTPLPSYASLIVPLDAHAGEGGVVARWGAPPGPPLWATPYRRVSGSDWVALPEVVSANDEFLVGDADVQPGYRYVYRLGLESSDGEAPTPEQAVDVPLSVAPALAIERLLPNPSSGALSVAFSRPDLATTKIEVIDLSGRRVFSRELGDAYGVRGIFDLGREVRLRPGLYQVLLVHGERVASAKAVVLR